MVFEWNDESIDLFFSRRKTTSKLECDEVARNIVGNGAVPRAVGTQGSLSYTVECTTKTIISFRQMGCILDSRVVNLSKHVHGGLVPDVSYCGNVGHGDETLIAYKMTCLPGQLLYELYPRVREIDSKDKDKCTTLYKQLAGYFARNWLKPLSETSGWEVSSLMEKDEFRTDETEVRRRLGLLKSSKLFPSVDAVVARIEESLPALFDRTGEWPTVLTHGDFSKFNILLDSQRFAVTGIIDWSRASISPFGLDLALLIELRSFSDDSDTTTEYSCWRELEDVFWNEFWSLTGIEDNKRARTRYLAEVAAELSILFQYSFELILGGAMKDDLATMNGPVLEAIFGSQTKDPAEIPLLQEDCDVNPSA